jgi:hypothetical protein
MAASITGAFPHMVFLGINKCSKAGQIAASGCFPTLNGSFQTLYGKLFLFFRIDMKGIFILTRNILTKRDQSEPTKTYCQYAGMG